MEQLFIIYITAKEYSSPIATCSKFISHYVIRTIIHSFTTAKDNEEDCSPIATSSKFIIYYAIRTIIHYLYHSKK